MDHILTGGTLLNFVLMPALLAGDSGIARCADLVRSHFKMDGHHVKFNVVTADAPRTAPRGAA